MSDCSLNTRAFYRTVRGVLFPTTEDAPVPLEERNVLFSTIVATVFDARHVPLPDDIDFVSSPFYTLFIKAKEAALQDTAARVPGDLNKEGSMQEVIALMKMLAGHKARVAELLAKKMTAERSIGSSARQSVCSSRVATGAGCWRCSSRS